MDPNEAVREDIRLFVSLLANYCEQLVVHLVAKQVVNQVAVDELMREVDAEARIISLVRELCKIGPQGVLGLTETLKQVGSQELLEYVRLLDNNLSEIEDYCNLVYLTSKLSKMSSSPLPPIRCPPSDSAGDGPGCSRMRPPGSGTIAEGGEVNEIIYFPVKPAREAKISERIYKMTRRPRGYCIILNNFIFDPPHVKMRLGSEHEAVYLRVIFQQLGYRVIVHENKTCPKILEMFDEVSQDPELENHDSLVVIILTHGDRGVLMGSDGDHVGVESIVGKFNNHNCKYLIHKPKLFFIQACRGGAYDYGAVDIAAVADAVPRPDNMPFENVPTLPTWTDTLICYSTVEGYVALRNEITGSWFGEAFGKVLMEHAWEHELHTLLQLVNTRLLRREGFDRIKQAIEVIYRGWSKAFYFNPGIYEDDSNETN